MDERETDSRLREMFKQNAPSQSESHLAAALHPERPSAPAPASLRRASGHTGTRRLLRIAAIAIGVVALAVAAGTGVWQAAKHLGVDKPIVVITDQTVTSATALDDAAHGLIEDGEWELQADRHFKAILPWEEERQFLSEDYYYRGSDGASFKVVVSQGGTKVQVEGNRGGTDLDARGTRTSTDQGRFWYDLDALGGGRFVIWQNADGLQGELTAYGGIGIVFSYRGKLVRAPESGSFDDTWMRTVAAVDGLGPTRVVVNETASGQIAATSTSSSADAEEPQTVSAVELLDTGSGRASLTVHLSSQLIKYVRANGRERLTSFVNPFLSVRAPASRSTSLVPPVGLPLPLWAGDAVSPEEGYSDLLSTGGAEISAKEVTTQTENGGTRLSWKRTSSKGTATVVVTLGPDLLPVRIEMAARAEVEGVMLDYSLTIDYEFQTAGSFSDSDFSTDVPQSQVLTSDTYELPTAQPLSDQADWGQYWIGEQMGEWSLTTARYETYRDQSVPEDKFVFLVYQRPRAAGSNEDLQVHIRSRDSQTTADARQLAEQQVTVGNWTRRETTIAGQSATVYSGPAEGQTDGRIDSIYVFLPDAFITIDLWNLADPQTVLDALAPIDTSG